jgi:hypothetical protein
MASVYRKGNKRGTYWYAAWRDHNGKRHTRCTKTTDKSAAERIAAKYEADAALRRGPGDKAGRPARDRQRGLRATGTDPAGDTPSGGVQRQAQRAGGETSPFGANSCLQDALTLADGNSADAPQVEPPCQVMRADATGDERGAGGSRTHDGGFAIRCLSLLATAPCSTIN